MWLRVLLGTAFFVVVLWLGFLMVRGLARPVERDSDIETEDVEAEDRRYRCSICGLEMRITQTPGEQAKPPRHCREDMEPV